MQTKAQIVKKINKKLSKFGTGPFNLNYQQLSTISAQMTKELNERWGGDWSCLMTSSFVYEEIATSKLVRVDYGGVKITIFEKCSDIDLDKAIIHL